MSTFIRPHHAFVKAAEEGNQGELERLWTEGERLTRELLKIEPTFVGSAIEPEKMQSAFSQAAQKGHLAVVKYFIDKGAKVDVTSALIEAIKHSRIKIVEYLIEQNADINATDSKGKDLVTVAREHKDLRIAKMIRDAQKAATREAKKMHPVASEN